jgi:GTPase SAR1 family protein
MIARLTPKNNYIVPVFEDTELRNESDVEQKLVFPFLTNASYLGVPSAWVRTKEYMTPTEIDKAAGRRFGYFPDCSIWLSGIPLVIGEVKDPSVTIETALREAQMYAGQVNKRYPPEVNPIGWVLACNGVQLALSHADSEIEVLIAPSADVQPGSSVLQAFQNAIGREALEERAKKLAPHFATRSFFAVSSTIGGQSKMTRQLGVNEFAQPLYPALARYFDDSSETPDEVIDRAYVTSDELSRYEGMLETYLKDRTLSLGGSQLKTIETSRTTANNLTGEISKFAAKPGFYSRVQLVVGAVGAGKSTFVRRYHRHLMAREVREKTIWAFIDFNATGPDIPDINAFVAEKFIESLAGVNGYDLYEEDQLDKILGPEMAKFEKSNRSLARDNAAEYVLKKSNRRDELMGEPGKFAEAISRYYAGERGQGLVVVFDNVDKRSRDQQLKIFESAQWFKELTKGLILVNLRDVTFEAHKDERPLDAFSTGVNFYIRPPRFAQVIRKRLELVLETLPSEVDKKLEYTLKTGQRIKYESSRLGEFLMSIYISLFDSRDVASMLEALVAKNVRRALGMFSAIIISPHISTNQITGAAIAGNSFRIPERHILRALMRGRYQYFNGRDIYVHDIISADDAHSRPSNFIFCDILEYLIRNRKERIDFNQEGYVSINTLVNEMSRLGYDEEDAFAAIMRLVEKGMIEPESLVETNLTMEDPVRAHGSGFVHSRLFLRQDEYIVGVTPVLKTASRETSQDIGSIWSGWDPQREMSLGNKVQILKKLNDYLALEYQRRCRRHAFYEEKGFGGRHLLESVRNAHSFLDGFMKNPQQRPQSYVPRRRAG